MFKRRMYEKEMRVATRFIFLIQGRKGQKMLLSLVLFLLQERNKFIL